MALSHLKVPTAIKHMMLPRWLHILIRAKSWFRSRTELLHSTQQTYISRLFLKWTELPGSKCGPERAEYTIKKKQPQLVAFSSNNSHQKKKKSFQENVDTHHGNNQISEHWDHANFFSPLRNSSAQLLLAYHLNRMQHWWLEWQSVTWAIKGKRVKELTHKAKIHPLFHKQLP